MLPFARLVVSLLCQVPVALLAQVHRLHITVKPSDAARDLQTKFLRIAANSPSLEKKISLEMTELSQNPNN